MAIKDYVPLALTWRAGAIEDGGTLDLENPLGSGARADLWSFGCWKRLLPVIVVTVSKFQKDSIGNCKESARYHRYLYC
jgi:hypothetical protein